MNFFQKWRHCEMNSLVAKKSSAEILQSLADLKQENAELSNQASQVKVLTLKLEASVMEAEALRDGTIFKG